MALTKEQKIQKTIITYIEQNKFLKDSKYYKNNYWSWAAWDSWAAQGKAGGCGLCSCKSYNGSLRNKRYHDKHKSISRNLCFDCVNKIEEIINHKFKKH